MKPMETSRELIIRRMLTNKFFLITTCIFCFANGLPLSAQVIDIGNRRQLLVDHKFVEDENNIEFQVHKPTKTGDTCITSGTGLPSVLEMDGIYHMWYSSSSISYARSYDGIHWEYPSLNLRTDSRTSKPNNTVLGHGAGRS